LIVLYNMMLVLGVAVGFPLIVPLVVTSRKRRKTMLQRLGLSRLPHQLSGDGKSGGDGKPIWIHALSVGEVISAVPLVRALERENPGRDIVFSASTLTGFEIARERLGDQVRRVFYYPYDFIFSVRRIADAVDPALVAIVETDLWPNFLFEMKRRAVPVILLNARLSSRSFRGYRRLGDFSKRIFSALARICPQTETDAKRFRRLGIPARRITVTGNLKFDQDRETAAADGTKRLKAGLHLMPGQPVVVAGSTHKGEEAMLLAAAALVKNQFPDLLLIIAPRNPDRARHVCRICREAGVSATLMKDLLRSAEIGRFGAVVVDTIGLLTALYGLSDIAFVGGSLVKCGGHNPLEPAYFSKPILFGPDMSDFSKIAGMLVGSGGAFQVRDVATLSACLSELLANPDKRRRMGLNSLAVFEANCGAVSRTLRIIEKIYSSHESQTPNC